MLDHSDDLPQRLVPDLSRLSVLNSISFLSGSKIKKSPTFAARVIKIKGTASLIRQGSELRNKLFNSFGACHEGEVHRTPRIMSWTSGFLEDEMSVF